MLNSVRRRYETALWLLAISFSTVSFATAEAEIEHDVVIYGGTSAGIAAAMQVKRMGGTVLVIEPSSRIGGLTTGGLGQTDIGNKGAIGGVAQEFYQRVKLYYDQAEHWKWQRREEYRDSGQTRTGPAEVAMWTFEPSAALAILQAWVREHDIPVVYRQRLDRTGNSRSGEPGRGVIQDRGRIISIRMESGETYRGRMFIDATYEGDLLAAVGMSYAVGREANAAYDETLNGVQTRYAKFHQFLPGFDPYVTPGESGSGLLPGIDPRGPGEEGSGDARVQDYGSLTPQPNECQNLLVPVCLSATHIAFGSIRMEPVFMVLGQSSATAAMLAIASDVAVQSLDYGLPRERLLADGQVLAWTGPVPSAATAIDPKLFPGIVVDDESAERRGFAEVSRVIGPYVGDGYRHDANSEKGAQSVRFLCRVTEAGR